MTTSERRTITARVLRGIRKDRHSDDGDQAYAEASENFTPHQLGALHRAMRECVSEMDLLDMQAEAQDLR